jgi:hypothetical protein
MTRKRESPLSKTITVVEKGRGVNRFDLKRMTPQTLTAWWNA